MSRKLDLTGQKFGRLLVLAQDSSKPKGATWWRCICDCGNSATVKGAKLVNGHTQSCSCLHKENLATRRSNDLTGQQFGRLTVTTKTSQRANGLVLWLCNCSCGETTTVRTTDLTRGHTTSCGCFDRERRLKHGMSYTKEYARIDRAYRRASQLQRTPAWADQSAIKDIYISCPDGYHVDHDIPLLGRLVSGLHVPENLVLLPAKDNLVKSNKFTPQIISSN